MKIFYLVSGRAEARSGERAGQSAASAPHCRPRADIPRPFHPIAPSARTFFPSESEEKIGRKLIVSCMLQVGWGIVIALKDYSVSIGKSSTAERRMSWLHITPRRRQQHFGCVESGSQQWDTQHSTHMRINRNNASQNGIATYRAAQALKLHSRTAPHYSNNAVSPKSTDIETVHRGPQANNFPSSDTPAAAFFAADKIDERQKGKRMTFESGERYF